jgi:hypothetical protein
MTHGWEKTGKAEFFAFPFGENSYNEQRDLPGARLSSASVNEQQES